MFVRHRLFFLRRWAKCSFVPLQGVGLPVPPGNRPNGWVDTPARSGANTPTHGTSSPLPIASPNQTPDVPPGLDVKQVRGVGTSLPARPPGIPAVPNAWGTTRIETAPSLKRD